MVEGGLSPVRGMGDGGLGRPHQPRGAQLLIGSRGPEMVGQWLLVC